MSNTSLPHSRSMNHANIQDPRKQRAQSMGREGYGLSELLCSFGTYCIWKPGSQINPYYVDLQEGRRTCTCTDFLTRPTADRDCKHILFTERCLTSVAASGVKWTREELQSSLYRPSRLDPVPAVKPQRVSDYDRRELALAARAGANPDLDF